MPGPQDLWNWVNKPLVPPSQTVDKLAQPGLNDSPAWAMAKGFGSGALEGLRQQTSPINLAALAGTGMAAKGAIAARQLAGAVPGAIEGLAGAIPKAATATVAPGAEFAPVGGEAAYNATRPAVQKVADPMEAVYKRIMSTMGRAQ
jgi:hypothetical protein